jgi:hypothetical protein
MGWNAGTQLLVEETMEGVLLKPVPTFVQTRPEDVFASLLHHGRPKRLGTANFDCRVCSTATAAF